MSTESKRIRKAIELLEAALDLDEMLPVGSTDIDVGELLIALEIIAVQKEDDVEFDELNSF